MTLTRKMAAKRLALEIGMRRDALVSAIDENEQAFRSADLAVLFLDNLEFIRKHLAGIPANGGEISLRSLDPKAN